MLYSLKLVNIKVRNVLVNDYIIFCCKNSDILSLCFCYERVLIISNKWYSYNKNSGNKKLNSKWLGCQFSTELKIHDGNEYQRHATEYSHLNELQIGCQTKEGMSEIDNIIELVFQKCEHL